MKPSLVGVFQRSGEGGHDLPTVSQISAYLGPLLVFANTFKPTPNFDGLLQFIEVQRALVNTREPIEMSAILFVELGELVQIIQVCSVAWGRSK